MFFKKLFLKKKQVPLEDTWIHFTRNKEEKKYFLRVNTVFSGIGIPKKYHHILKISFKIDTEKKDELLGVYEIENTLSAVLEQKFSSIFVGTKKSDTKYKLFFYLKNTENIVETINTAMMQHSDYQFSISIEKDKKWKYYFKKLLPSGLEYQTYLNEQKFLGKYKDFLQKKEKREMFYFISLKNQKVFHYFEQQLYKNGFTIISKGAGKRKGFPYAVKISKISDFNLKYINEQVEYLYRLSENYNFKYEGWLVSS